MDLQKEIEKLKVKAGYDGKPQQWQYGFDLACRELGKQPQWVSVEDALPEYCTPVLVFCANANYKHDGLKTIVASYQSGEDLFETSEIFDSEDDVVDSWIAETSMFDDEYGGRFINDGVTHWMPLPEPPTKECE